MEIVGVAGEPVDNGDPKSSDPMGIQNQWEPETQILSKTHRMHKSQDNFQSLQFKT